MFYCGICKKRCGSGSFHCSVCQNWVHLSCNKITFKEVKLKENNNETLVCINCKEDLKRTSVCIIKEEVRFLDFSVCYLGKLSERFISLIRIKFNTKSLTLNLT